MCVEKQLHILQQTKAFVLSRMSENDAAHNKDHILRVVSLTQALCKAYPRANAFRAELLAWVHDLNDDKLASDIGQTALSDHLRSISLSAADIAFVVEALPYISYRKHPRLSPDTPLEIRIVQDADRIDAMGAIGIARTFAYGGAKGRSLSDSLSHFDEKLLILYDLLNTEEARRIALPRYEFLKAFYTRFREEADT